MQRPQGNQRPVTPPTPKKRGCGCGKRIKKQPKRPQ